MSTTHYSIERCVELNTKSSRLEHIPLTNQSTNYIKVYNIKETNTSTAVHLQITN